MAFWQKNGSENVRGSTSDDTHIELNDLKTDSPALTKAQDRFKRYEFSKRIANIISTSKHDRSLVIGIFGKWGDGKSSILNFIKGEISPENCLCVDFNPWLFTDEKQLLNAFFLFVANALNKSLIPAWKKYVKNISTFAGLISKLTSYIGFDKDKIEELSEKFGETSLEDLKKKLGDSLKLENRKIIVFIDDIDRLTSKEIQMVFKLVKNVGDFQNIVYVLAFDDEIVATALAPEYGSEDSAFGHKFLEKIIQVPLRIPKASSASIKEYTFDLINGVYKSLGIVILEEDAKEFQNKFEAAFISHLTNPRFPLRYSINLSFIIPLLYGEVNIVDLMLIEGIKVFQPELYSFLRDNKHSLLTDYNSFPSIYQTNEDYKSIAQEYIDKELSKYSGSLRSLTYKLFPALYGLFKKDFSFEKEKESNPLKEKRVCSSDYFDKYFEYSITKEILSDIYINQLIHAIEHQGLEQTGQIFEDLFRRENPIEVLSKFENRYENLTDETKINLFRILSKKTDFFPPANTFPSFSSPQIYLTSFLINCLSGLKLEKQSDLISFLAMDSNCDFAYELNRTFERRKEEFDNAEILLEILRASIVREFKAHDFINNFFSIASDATTAFVIINWGNDVRPILSEIINARPENAVHVIKVFIPTFYSSEKSAPYKSEFPKDSYDLLKQYVHIETLYKNIMSTYGKVELENASWRSGDEISDNDIIFHFLKYYDEDNITQKK